MPKLPRGMFRRKPGGSWYLRLYRGGRERWVSLGADYAEALAKAEEVRSSKFGVLAGRMTVSQASERWLEVYVRIRRNEKGQQITAARVRRYLEPFLGHLPVERVTGEDVRAYRL